MTKTLWITYAWLDNEDGDFNYLVSALSEAGVSARYDERVLIPGQRLWDQIANQIERDDLNGWAYLLTRHSISSQACREELAYALNRALRSRGSDFPLIGLLHQLPMTEVPAPLRSRLCVDLGDSDWVEKVRAGLEKQPPFLMSVDTTNLKCRVHNPYLGDPNLYAVEFAPRFGEIHYWRIAYPGVGLQPVQKGIGPAGGAGRSGVLQNSLEGSTELKGVAMKFFGAGDPLTPSTAAYVVFNCNPPTFLAFGCAKEPYGLPSSWQPFDLRKTEAG